MHSAAGDRGLGPCASHRRALNAPGLHKSALIQEEGGKRDLAPAVTGTLDTVSGALFLTCRGEGSRRPWAARTTTSPSTGVVAPAPTTTPGRRRLPIAAREVLSLPAASPLDRRRLARGGSRRLAPPLIGASPSSSRSRGRRQHRERPRAPGRVRLVRARPGGDTEAAPAPARPHARRERRPRLHDRTSRKGRSPTGSVARAGPPNTAGASRRSGRPPHERRLPRPNGSPDHERSRPDRALRHDQRDRPVRGGKMPGRASYLDTYFYFAGPRRLRASTSRTHAAAQDAGRRRRPLRARRGDRIAGEM